MALPSRGGILRCHIENLQSLYACYLPFVKNGAIFIPSEHLQNLGDEVFVAVTLPGSHERLPLHGKVVWINQRNQSNRPSGFAVQFEKDEAGLRMKNEIERLLAGMINSAEPTYTM